MKKLLIFVLLIILGSLTAFIIIRLLKARHPPTLFGWRAHVTTLAGDGSPAFRDATQPAPSGFAVRLYGFSSNLVTLPTADAAAPTGSLTATADALEELLISADIGVAATDRIISAVKARSSTGESLREIAFPDRIDAGLRVTNIGRSSVRYEIGIFASGGELCALGHFVHVFVDSATRKPVTIPEKLRAALTALRSSAPAAQP